MNLGTIVIALFIFGFLIFIHELGHYLTARAFGVSIREFAIGMGPKLFSHCSQKTGIRYSLRALPIGGFVSMVGEDEESEDENAFHRKPVWQRIIVTAAGAFMNLAVGVIVMSLLVMTQDILPSTEIGAFVQHEDGTPNYTQAAGFQVGDKIVEIEGTRVRIANELVYEVMRRGIEPLDVTVLRNGERITMEDVIFPTIVDHGIRYGTVDFKVTPEVKTPAVILKHAVFRSTSTIKMIWESLYDLVNGRYGVESVSGPVGVTKALGEAAESGFDDLIYLAVVISMNLGVMNLLPLPALDGGRLLFQIIELFRRKPVRPEIEGYVHFAGMVMLMILMVVVAVKDIFTLI
ncbi:MAG: site-2 protease family protein [Clostridia bacterium]|nr:site-2 protease family protein [Oscillospiraceae bacterium]MBO5257025.1 site-2 protease family protein [Clostridia bacterium]MBP3293369.1 site-2 protease family protein [Clostridia bacterium]